MRHCVIPMFLIVVIIGWSIIILQIQTHEKLIHNLNINKHWATQATIHLFFVPANMSRLTDAMAVLIGIFKQHAGKEGDNTTLTKKELVELLHSEFPDIKVSRKDVELLQQRDLTAPVFFKNPLVLFSPAHTTKWSRWVLQGPGFRWRWSYKLQGVCHFCDSPHCYP